MISRKAARERIIEDVKTTVTAAAARASGPDGATWGVAESRLGSIIALWEATLAKANAARAALAPLAAAVTVADEKSDHVIKSNADVIWNELGRPANDPVYELLFPGGAGFYTDANEDEQPDMMLLLAELLESGLHPKLVPTMGSKVAAIREAANALGAAVEAARKPRAQVRLYDRMLTTVGRTAHFELAKLKRYWKSEGLSEADVHAVIPDRPRSYGVPNTPDSPTPTPTPSDPPA
ncbi:MAG: hypothetical protein IT377_09145 [Polyangiaceae bacterium]|nr:hypothetical protein [Polyangiaceae bacterium]